MQRSGYYRNEEKEKGRRDERVIKDASRGRDHKNVKIRVKDVRDAITEEEQLLGAVRGFIIIGSEELRENQRHEERRSGNESSRVERRRQDHENGFNNRHDRVLYEDSSKEEYRNRQRSRAYREERRNQEDGGMNRRRVGHEEHIEEIGKNIDEMRNIMNSYKKLYIFLYPCFVF